MLSKAGSLPSGLQIKPDMTREERLTESILLKERWALIQKETDHKTIKIRGNKIFVNNKLHGEVKNSSLVIKTSLEEQMDPKLPNSEMHITNQTDYILKLLIINCRSIQSQSKRTELAVLLSHHNIDIVIGNESHIDSTFLSSEIFTKLL